MKHFLLVLLLLIWSTIHIYPRDDIPADSTNEYIEDLTDLLILRLYTLTKFNTLEILDPAGRMIMRPNGNTNLGWDLTIKASDLASRLVVH